MSELPTISQPLSDNRASSQIHIQPLKWVSRFPNLCIRERWSCRCEIHSFWRKRGVNSSKHKHVSYDSLVNLRQTFISDGKSLLQLLLGRHTRTYTPFSLQHCLTLPWTLRLRNNAASGTLSWHMCCKMHKGWGHVSEQCFSFHPWNRLCVQPGRLPAAFYLPHWERLNLDGEEKEAPLYGTLSRAHAPRDFTPGRGHKILR